MDVSPFYLDECLAMLEVWPSFASQANLRHNASAHMVKNDVITPSAVWHVSAQTKVRLKSSPVRLHFRNTKLIMLEYFCLPCTVWLFFFAVDWKRLFHKRREVWLGQAWVPSIHNRLQQLSPNTQLTYSMHCCSHFHLLRVTMFILCVWHKL